MIWEHMPALGNGLLKNANISIASKVWIMMPMNWRQNFGLVGITKLIGLPNRTYPGRSCQYLSASCRSRGHRRFLHSLPSAFSPVLGTILSEQMKISSEKKGAAQSIWLEFSQDDYMLRLDGMIKDDKELDAFLWRFRTRVVISVLHFNPVEWQNCVKLQSQRQELDNQAAAWHCLSSFFQWLMISTSVCRLPKLRKWRKYSERTGSVMLMFCHFMIAWRGIWNGRICGYNLSQVNYTRSYALKTCNWLCISS